MSVNGFTVDAVWVGVVPDVGSPDCPAQDVVIKAAMRPAPNRSVKWFRIRTISPILDSAGGEVALMGGPTGRLVGCRGAPSAWQVDSRLSLRATRSDGNLPERATSKASPFEVVILA